MAADSSLFRAIGPDDTILLVIKANEGVLRRPDKRTPPRIEAIPGLMRDGVLRSNLGVVTQIQTIVNGGNWGDHNREFVVKPGTKWNPEACAARLQGLLERIKVLGPPATA